MLLSGLLLLMFWALITRHADPSYHFTTGLDTNVYLGRWLVLSGAAFGVSAVLFALHAGRRHRRQSTQPMPSGSDD